MPGEAGAGLTSESGVGEGLGAECFTSEIRSCSFMKTSLWSFLRVHGLCAALVLAGGSAVGQEAPGPGPEHKELARLAGEWVATIKGPDGETPGTMVARVECGGLWLATEFTGQMGGAKFQGRGLDGYDPASKKYVSVWVDSWSTKPLLFEGTMDAATKSLTMTATGVGMDGKPAKYKSVTRYPSADRQVFELYLVGADGKDEKMMTIEYARKK